MRANIGPKWPQIEPRKVSEKLKIRRGREPEVATGRRYHPAFATERGDLTDVEK